MSNEPKPVNDPFAVPTPVTPTEATINELAENKPTERLKDLNEKTKPYAEFAKNIALVVSTYALVVKGLDWLSGASGVYQTFKEPNGIPDALARVKNSAASIDISKLSLKPNSIITDLKTAKKDIESFANIEDFTQYGVYGIRIKPLNNMNEIKVSFKSTNGKMFPPFYSGTYGDPLDSSSFEWKKQYDVTLKNVKAGEEVLQID